MWGGNPESIRAEVEGLLVPPADVDALVHAIRRLIASKELCAVLGTAAQTRQRERFTVDIMVERTAQWLLETHEMQRFKDSAPVVTTRGATR